MTPELMEFVRFLCAWGLVSAIIILACIAVLVERVLDKQKEVNRG